MSSSRERKPGAAGDTAVQGTIGVIPKSTSHVHHNMCIQRG
jgi:hypothetical protein